MLKFKNLFKSRFVIVALVVFVLGLVAEFGYYNVEMNRIENDRVHLEVVEVATYNEKETDSFVIGVNTDKEVHDYVVRDENGVELAIPSDTINIQFLEEDTDALPTVFILRNASGEILNCDLFVPNETAMREI